MASIMWSPAAALSCTASQYCLDFAGQPALLMKKINTNDILILSVANITHALIPPASKGLALMKNDRSIFHPSITEKAITSLDFSWHTHKESHKTHVSVRSLSSTPRLGFPKRCVGGIKKGTLGESAQNLHVTSKQGQCKNNHLHIFKRINPRFQ